MTPEQQAAYVVAQAICCLGKIESMKAANRVRADKGEVQAYTEEAFVGVAAEFGIEHNQVIALYQGRSR